MHTIGRSDRVDFPELGLFDVQAKIDSGAFTSSIHCENITAFYRNNEHCIRFELIDDEKRRVREYKVFASRQVRNSFGEAEYRYTIKTTVLIFGKKYVIELALTNRARMKYPVLLGRQLLGERFVIDVTKINLSYKDKKSQKLKSKE